MFVGKEGKRIAQITVRKIDEEGVPRESKSFSIFDKEVKDIDDIVQFLKDKINESEKEVKKKKK